MAADVAVSAVAFTTGPQTSVTTSAIDTTGCQVLLVGLAWYGSGSAPANITDNKGNSIPQYGSTVAFTADALAKTAVYKLEGGTVGTGHTFTATFGANQDRITLLPDAISGAPSSSAIDQFAAGNEDTSSAYVSGSVTTTDPNDLLVAFAFTFTAAAGPEVLDWSANSFTQVSQQSSGNDFAGASAKRLLSSTGTYNSSFTSTGASTSGAITYLFAIKPAVSGPVVSTLSPADDATGVSVTTNLAATFDQGVSAGSGDVDVYEYTDPASAPSVQVRATDTTGTADTTTFTVDWTAPGGGFLDNDIIFIAVAKDDDDAITTLLPSSDWKQVWDTNTGTAARCAGIFRRVPAGFSGTNIALVGDSESWAARIWIIRGVDPLTDPVCSTPATGVSTAANPTSVTFPWGTDPTLVIAVCGGDGNSSASAYPSGYGNTGTHNSGHTTTGSRSWLAYAELASDTSGSEDPGAFTNTNDDWVAVTVAFRGAPTDTLIETISITDGSKVSISGSTVTVDPAATLAASKAHYVNIDSGAIIASDDSAPFPGISGRTAWSFTTGAAASVGAWRPAVMQPMLRAKRSLMAPAVPVEYVGVGRWQPIGAAAVSSAPPGISTETDSALALASAHLAAPGIATETDSSLALAAAHVAVPGVALETDAALAPTASHVASPGVAAETDTAQALSSIHTAPPGVSTETDTALALSASHVAAPGVSTETDSAFGPGGTTPGVALETDTALALAASHVAPPGIAIETDTSLAVAASHVAPPGVATSSNTAFALTSTHAAAPGVSAETDVALALSAGHVAAPGVATEVDTALGLSTTHVATPGIATETDSALVPGSGATGPGIALETDTALALSASHVAPVGLATSTNAALALAASHVAPPGVATETDTAFGRSSTHVAVPGVSTETDAALAMPAAHVAPFGLATEVDAAFTLPSVHVAPPGVATETDAAFARPAAHIASPGIASELDVALAPAIGAPPGVATETNVALALGSQHVAPPGIALESNVALALVTVHVAAPGVAVENDSALVPGSVGAVIATFESYVLGDTEARSAIA